MLQESREDALNQQEYENKFDSLQKMQEHFVNLYGRRNNVYLPGRNVRISLFHRGVADLIDALRKESDRETLEVMFARTASRVFCLANGINDVSVSEGMMKKYPLEGCSYCHNNPCQCAEKRSDADLEWGSDNTQMSWSLRDWQNHLRALYGEKNKQKGMDYVMNRLSSEVGELISLEYDVPNCTMDTIEKEYRLELADSMAWTMAAANLLDIDLQEAIIKRYGNGCKSCGITPCNCGSHSFKQVRIS